MSEDRAAEQNHGGEQAEAFSSASEALVDLTQQILDKTIRNLIYGTAVACHAREKQLRAQSAATQAESLALANLEPPSQKGANGPSAVPAAVTDAARYDNGRVFLKGNPLKTTPEIVCPHCKLPRLMHPIMGKGSQHPDLTKDYCKLYPFVQQKLHDVYGNPFPIDVSNKSKKERELLKAQQKSSDKDGGTPASMDAEALAQEAQGREIKQLNTGGKPASYIPWHTCPNCKRSLLITKFARHLESCLGIGGRQSSRNAMAKLTGNGSASTGVANTPLGSRMGTPAPGAQDVAKGRKGGSPAKTSRLADGSDDDMETPEKKKKKKSSYIKKADRERMAKEGSGPQPLPLQSLKVKLKTSGLKERPDVDRRARDGGSEKPDKRDRDEGDDGAPKPKKIKLSMGKSETPLRTEAKG